MIDLQQLENRKPVLQDQAEYHCFAVLLPLLEIDGETHILFEVRAACLKRQPGEICFPGGKIEAGEQPYMTALRETEEELGLAKREIQIAGSLDYMVVPPGTLIYPFVGVLTDPANICPNSGEVEKIFTVPLDFFLTNTPQISKMEVTVQPEQDFPLAKVPPVYRKTWRRWSYSVYFYEYRNYIIWGITSRILVNFIKIIQPGIKFF